MENNELRIVVDDGSVDVPVYNTHGDKVGMFKFRPTDIGIIKRFNEVSEKFGDIVKPLEDVNIGGDGKAERESDVRVLTEAENKLYELCDYLFDGEMSKAFFGKMNPFSPVNGSFYCEEALNRVADFISKQFDSETKKIDKKLDKYLHGYRTGAHKNGRK